MNPLIVGIATAVPTHSISQAQAAQVLIEAAGLSGNAADFAVAMHRRSGIDRRGSVLLTDTPAADAVATNDFFVRPEARVAPRDHKGPTTNDRMKQYAVHAPKLAGEAAEKAMRISRVNPAEITHLVTVSCTGFAAPGVDHALIESLGMSRSVQRLQIGFMGCHGGIVGLRTAADLCRAATVMGTPARVLLVCVELCSLHMQYSERPDQIVSAALFGDGAAAAVLTNVPADLERSTSICPLATGASLSLLLPESADLMGWLVGDHGFEMMLGEHVPRVIAENVGDGVRRLLAGMQSGWDAPGECAGWVIHPGGPKVLSAVADALSLSTESMKPSREILRKHGNMSSPTVLFILEELLATRALEPTVGDAIQRHAHDVQDVQEVHGAQDAHAGGARHEHLGTSQATATATMNMAPSPIVMLAFGPGLTVEGLALVHPGSQATA